ncbi:MAG: zf-TFIIB domain-containing protein [Oligoflexales bacterium]|nr:zf-TFIIB domain-containing protein [Oligoflexales bacterium]
MTDISKIGYDKEEEYFYKLNKELIEKKRAQLDSSRQKQEQKSKAFWMVCPKCGGSMQEVDVLGVKLDRCGSCKGTYFDHGEMELLFEAKDSQNFMSFLKGVFNTKK